MKGTGAGWDSCLYRVFIVLGLVGVVASVVVSSMVFPPGSRLPLMVGGVALVIFFALLMSYWAVQVFFKGYNSLQMPDPSQKTSVDDLAALSNWNKLFLNMTIGEMDLPRVKAAVRKGNSSQMIWFVGIIVIGLCPIVFMLPFLLGVLDWSLIWVPIILYVGLVIVTVLMGAVFGKRGKEAADEALFLPLGLQVTKLPQVNMYIDRPRVQGETVLEGTRFKKQVHIRMGVRQVLTFVSCSVQAFEMNDVLPIGNVPDAVQSAVNGLSVSTHWSRVKFSADEKGITAVRRAGGWHMWLYDLWLIERMIRATEK